MASEAAIARRRAEAETSVNDHVSALAARYSIETNETTLNVRDIELRRVIQMETLASALGEIRAGIEAATPKVTFPKDFPGYDVLGQVEGMTPDKLQAMSDEDVLAIKGIGKVTLEEIRAFNK